MSDENRCPHCETPREKGDDSPCCDAAENKQLKEHLRGLREVLSEFATDVEVTGGVKKINGLHAPVVDESWGDLGETYIKACAVLGRKPKVEK